MRTDTADLSQEDVSGNPAERTAARRVLLNARCAEPNRDRAEQIAVTTEATGQINADFYRENVNRLEHEMSELRNQILFEEG